MYQLNEKKVRICLVIHSLQAGGMERVMSELASYFAKQDKVETHLVLYGVSREIFYPLPASVIVHKPEFPFNNKQRFVSTVKTIRYLRKTIQAIEPHSVLSFGEYWNNFVLLSMLGLRIPVFVSDRSQPDKSLGRLHDFLRKKLYPRAKGLILQTEKARQIFLQKNKHANIAVIGNPIRSLSPSPNGTHREKIILMVGRLIRSKHQDHLIEIFARIDAPDWKLMLVGYDHLKQENMSRLKHLCKELGLADRVIFTGKHDRVEELYRKSAVFAFTSSSEGFPNVIGEAMMAGLPVVAYDCVAGPSEMIEDGCNGYLVPLFDQEQFAEKLTWLIQNQELRVAFGNLARQSIQRFSKDFICEKFLHFITK